MCGNGLKQGCPRPSPSLAGEGVDGSHSCSWAATAPDWHIFCFPLTCQAVCILLSAPGKDGSLWDKGSMMRQGWYSCQPPQLDLLLHGLHTAKTLSFLSSGQLLLVKPTYYFTKVVISPQTGDLWKSWVTGRPHGGSVTWAVGVAPPKSPCLYEQEHSLHWTPLLNRRQRTK